jgi:hypothetical protein
MTQITLPHLGTRQIAPHPREPGHYLWLDAFGWHDCSRSEDEFINAHAKTTTDTPARP